MIKSRTARRAGLTTCLRDTIINCGKFNLEISYKCTKGSSVGWLVGWLVGWRIILIGSYVLNNNVSTTEVIVSNKIGR
jgi:hypothetical protein